ncbi:hypothetical protein [Aureimonas altamirensis]|uniref:Uncharacterized protein n=1 Tax=Aureimonas altamirensis TaxID=370622 RepID=A0A0P0YXQ2_9HYPH|nr:hypothetical protein [Aureimonas altamirensis]BAT26056.1 hypothetical protein [Aureimonas altamirensis]
MNGLAFIATVLSSGVVAALTSFLMAARRDLHLSRQQKAEQLYIAADTFYRDLGGHLIGLLPIIKDRGSIYSGSDIAPDPAKSRANVEMLISFYFPNIRPAWDQLDRARAAAVHAMIEYDKGRAGVREYDAALSLWEPAGKGLLEAIAQEGRRYSTFDPLTDLKTWMVRIVRRH